MDDFLRNYKPLYWLLLFRNKNPHWSYSHYTHHQLCAKTSTVTSIFLLHFYDVRIIITKWKLLLFQGNHLNYYLAHKAQMESFFKQIKDHRSNVHNLSSWKEEAWKKIQAWTGLEPMTSAIPVQRSNRLSYQANWELVTCEFVESFVDFVCINCAKVSLTTRLLF